MTEEELIEYIFILENEVDFLREELRKEKKKTSDKINKDYEDNRNMIANIFKEVVKNDTKRKTTNDRR
jgi:hypothetical protein